MNKLHDTIKKSAYYKSNGDFRNIVDDIICDNIIYDKKFERNLEILIILDNFSIKINWGTIIDEYIVEEKLNKLYDLFE